MSDVNWNLIDSGSVGDAVDLSNVRIAEAGEILIWSAAASTPLRSAGALQNEVSNDF